MSITHNKRRIPVLNLLINCILARLAPQILSMKGEGTFLFLNFLVIGLCNSSGYSCVTKFKGRWFEILSFLIALSEAFYQKIYRH